MFFSCGVVDHGIGQDGGGVDIDDGGIDDFYVDGDVDGDDVDVCGIYDGGMYGSMVVLMVKVVVLMVKMVLV